MQAERSRTRLDGRAVVCSAKAWFVLATASLILADVPQQHKGEYICRKIHIQHVGDEACDREVCFHGFRCHGLIIRLDLCRETTRSQKMIDWGITGNQYYLKMRTARENFKSTTEWSSFMDWNKQERSSMSSGDSISRYMKGLFKILLVQFQMVYVVCVAAVFLPFGSCNSTKKCIQWSLR